jgi:hypothetical protein
MTMKLLAVPLIAGVLLSAAHAETVYRCGSTYTQTPCPQSTAVEVSDSRSPAQRADARAAAEGERRHAAQMRQERLADQRAIVPAGAISLSGPTAPKVVAVLPAKAVAKKRRHANGKPPATTDFVAYDPSSRKHRRGRA